MENLWVLYLVTRLDSIVNLFISLALISVIGAFVCAMNYHDNTGAFYKARNEDALKVWKRYGKFFVFFSLLFYTAQALMPSKEDAMFIAAGVGITEVVKSEEAKRIASGSVKVVETWLAKQEKELKKETK